MSRSIFYIPFIVLLLTGIPEANSRVAFSRPGNMIRIPNMDNSMYKHLFVLDVSSEILSSTQSSSAFSINTLSKSRYPNPSGLSSCPKSFHLLPMILFLFDFSCFLLRAKLVPSTLMLANDKF